MTRTANGGAGPASITGAVLLTIFTVAITMGGYLAGQQASAEPTRAESIARLDSLLSETRAVRDSLRDALATVDSILNTGGCHEIRYYLDR